MDLTAALTPDEVAALTDVECTWEDVAQRLRAVRSSVAEEDAVGDIIWIFEESIRFKNTLDVYERKVYSEPSWENLSVILNCEYRLYCLNKITPLRYNPFLSHWVEAIQRLERDIQPLHPAGSSGHSDNAPNRFEVLSCRLLMIETLLEAEDGLHPFVGVSPKDIYCNLQGLTTVMQDFTIEQYVRILEEEFVYTPRPEETSDPDTTPPSTPPPQSSKYNEKTPTTEPSENLRPQQHQIHDNHSSHDSHDWKQTLLFQLHHDPATALSSLSHLPIELPYLDFLTTLLSNKTLASLSIEPSYVICSYLQHALRLAEKMGHPSHPLVSGSRDLDSFYEAASRDGEALLDGINGMMNEMMNGMMDGSVDHSRAAQVRAVRLLLLFISNLIRKGLLEPEAIYYEIQEICVRYVWIPEVREFRVWVEEGGARVDGDGDGAGG